jgi:hypothetical protein
LAGDAFALQPMTNATKEQYVEKRAIANIVCLTSDGART